MKDLRVVNLKAMLISRLRDLKSGSEEIFPISVGDMAIELIGQPDTLFLDINLEDSVTVRCDNTSETHLVSIFDINVEDLEFIVDTVAIEVADNNTVYIVAD